MQFSQYFQQLEPPTNVVDMLGVDKSIPNLDHLYAYLMSSNDESQRIELIESFINACREVTRIVQFLWMTISVMFC